MFRMAPAHQRFGADDLPGGHAGPRLEVHLELAVVERATQPGFDLEPAQQLLVHPRLEHLHAAHAARLGVRQRGVGVPQQHFGAHAVARIARDADADRDVDLLAVDGERLGQQLGDLLGDALRVVGVAQAPEHDRELVGAAARDEVRGPHHVHHAARRLLQQCVADPVAECVVELGEFVDVDDHHGELVAGQLVVADRLVEPRLEQPPVRQPGPVVVQRHAARTLLDLAALVHLGHQPLVGPRQFVVGRAHPVLELLARAGELRFGGLALGDVLDHPHGFAGESARRDALHQQPRPEASAVAAPGLPLHRRRAVGRQRVADLRRERLELLFGREHDRRRSAEQVRLLPPEQAGGARVALHDLAVADDEDADRVVGEQRLVLLQPARDVALVEGGEKLVGSLAHGCPCSLRSGTSRGSRGQARRRVWAVGPRSNRGITR